MSLPGKDLKELLQNLNVPQMTTQNKRYLDELGGVQEIAKVMNVSLKTGLVDGQVLENAKEFGMNTLPVAPMESFLKIFLGTFNDLTLMILIGASIVSLAIGLYQDPLFGWTEGFAILVAVFIVALVTATNDYTKELKFRDLERTSQLSEEVSVLRNNVIKRIHTTELVIGDVISLQVIPY